MRCNFLFPRRPVVHELVRPLLAGLMSGLEGHGIDTIRGLDRRGGQPTAPEAAGIAHESGCVQKSSPVASCALRGTFVFAILVAIYGLIAEKTIAIEFARKELVGTCYLETIRGLYGVLLTAEPTPPADLSPRSPPPRPTPLGSCRRPSSISNSSHQPASGRRAGTRTHRCPAPGGARAQRPASRVGDDSNLTLDPDLDTYYLQNVWSKACRRFSGSWRITISLITVPTTTIAASDDRGIRHRARWSHLRRPRRLACRSRCRLASCSRSPGSCLARSWT